jgi:hypothetical protein
MKEFPFIYVDINVISYTIEEVNNIAVSQRAVHCGQPLAMPSIWPSGMYSQWNLAFP